ncbi:hypothetical protein RC86_04335 [Pectobacterium brasiliense]|nr:hypothetical protein B5S52_07595 [Pectobacterium brasiliense]KHS93360.1 hypothetical protein RC86_04335 [Pectobacterium brasiliense]KHT00965.1 hypothetical protein RC90_04290 [Pectobacterium brasiliense]KHT42288.1 hypothetical protein RD02_06485 [Pectobacterium brasiliense]
MWFFVRRAIKNASAEAGIEDNRINLNISVILQADCALAAFKYSARRGPRPKGPLQAAFKSAPSRFVTPVTYLSKLLGIRAVAAFKQLELFRI